MSIRAFAALYAARPAAVVVCRNDSVCRRTRSESSNPVATLPMMLANSFESSSAMGSAE